MQAARLQLALESGAFSLPAAGDIAVLAPRAGDDLSALPGARVVVLTGFRPDHEHFAALGYRMASTGPVALALVSLPRARAAARALVARAADLVGPGGQIVLDGQKTDGIDSLVRECRDLGLAVGAPLSKAHGKLAVLTAGAALAGWRAAPQQIAGGLVTLPGIFSADAPDRGSELLAAALPARLPARLGDLGAGWGFLAREVLARPGVQQLDLVEAEADALACAKLNIPDPRAAFHWADARSFRPARPWDAVVMNPPFHTTRAADPALGLAFLTAAQRNLTPSGTLWLVANRHLPYDKALRGLFRQVEDIGGDAVFRLTRAALPLRASAGQR